MHDMTFQQLSFALPTSRIALPVSYVFNIYIYTWMEAFVYNNIYITLFRTICMTKFIQNFKAL
jgi:hypothetical protein